MNFQELKNIIEAKNSQRPLLSKTQRDIHHWERELRLGQIETDFETSLAELDPEKADEQLPPHNYTRRNYILSWRLINKKFAFCITNKLANKTIPLIDCPEHIQLLTTPFLARFIAKMDEHLQINYVSDESSDNSEFESKVQ